MRICLLWWMHITCVFQVCNIVATIYTHFIYIYIYIYTNIYTHTHIHKKRSTQSYNIWLGRNQELKLIERADFLW